MEVGGGGWRWINLGGGGWRWINLDGAAWRWMHGLAIFDDVYILIIFLICNGNV